MKGDQTGGMRQETRRNPEQIRIFQNIEQRNTLKKLETLNSKTIFNSILKQVKGKTLLTKLMKHKLSYTKHWNLKSQN